jgi:hypothetical protein
MDFRITPRLDGFWSPYLFSDVFNYYRQIYTTAFLMINNL